MTQPTSFAACLLEHNRPQPEDITAPELTRLAFAAKALEDIVELTARGVGVGATYDLGPYNGDELEIVTGRLEVITLQGDYMNEVTAQMVGRTMLENWHRMQGTVLPASLRTERWVPNRVVEFADRLLTLDGTVYDPTA